MLGPTAATNLVPNAPVQSGRGLDALIETKSAPSRRTLRGLDWLNFFLADVQTGVGPFLAIYLAGYVHVSGFQLKIIQEVVTITVFIGFAILFLKEKLAWNYLVAFAFLGVAAFFAFAFKAPGPGA
jgi:drug/metabolite transporter (DMT)-like permease